MELRIREAKKVSTQIKKAPGKRLKIPREFLIRVGRFAKIFIKAFGEKMAKILVTGGSGFIGSHIVEHFHKTDEVVVLDNLRTGFKKDH